MLSNILYFIWLSYNMDNNLADSPADSLFTSIKLFMEQEANPFLTQYLKTQMLRQIKNQHC